MSRPEFPIGTPIPVKLFCDKGIQEKTHCKDWRIHTFGCLFCTSYNQSEDHLNLESDRT